MSNSAAYYQVPSFNPSLELQTTLHEIQNVVNHLNGRRDRGLSKSLQEKIFQHFKISHVYNSNAIEGNLLSLRETELILNNLTVNEKPFKDQVEARSLAIALDYLHGLINGNVLISSDSLMEIHGLLMFEIPNVEAGRLRKQNVSISQAVHTPPKWEYVPDHLADLFKWYARERNLSPIIKGAILHHYLTWVHPFDDGNGRVSRLMLNFHLLQHGFPEIVIRVEDRDRYYHALMEADQGDITAIVELCCDKLYETVAIYEQFINEEIREKEWIQKYTIKGYEQRIETARYNYEVWKAAMDVFRTRFVQTISAIENQFADLRFFVRTYDMIPFNTYLDIIENRPISKTWFLKLSIGERDGNDISFVFYFGRFRIPQTSNNLVKLFISAHQGGHYNELSVNIDLVNIGLKKDRLIIGIRDKENRRRVVSRESLPQPVIRDFVDQILQEYYRY